MMDMTIRPMIPAERNYCYSQSQQISMQTGLIGHLRADMDSNGNGFFSTFFDFRADLKTEDFKTEFDDVINALRFDENFGGALKDRTSLAAYCRRSPESSFGEDGREFGFRTDTEQYSYLLRLNPNRGEYNLYCYCYQRKWLDRHLQQAEKGIRFIDPHYKELFRIPDGDQIRITYADGEKRDSVCRYIDDYHVETGSVRSNLLHICQFAEMMERNGSTVIPLRSSLPEQCYGVLPDTGELIIIKKGESGYYRTDFATTGKEETHALADEYNGKAGVNKAQAAAMMAGSMFGWPVPAADPKHYDENGQPIRPKQKDRGDAR